MKQATLCYCIRGNEILLGLKKVRFGAGKWNGYGGKVDPGETNEEAAARELFEESGIATDHGKLEKIADIQFFFSGKPVFQCHAYIAREWDGEPVESEEMAPRWFAIDAMPLESMWISDAAWLREALSGSPMAGTVYFNDDGSVIEHMDLRKTSF
ncbi:MAG: 8-oxo-dGTP diphosphatase [Candidatus Pacebacteria bacterium]|nr:8-oxo-dGTP diphosphatase [Candidatus Paceibacterota bacterium]